MRASTVIARLQHLVKEHGDVSVFMDTDPHGLHPITEIDVDAEDTGIILYTGEVGA